jgi:hypothetical protein
MEKDTSVLIDILSDDNLDYFINSSDSEILMNLATKNKHLADKLLKNFDDNIINNLVSRFFEEDNDYGLDTIKIMLINKPEITLNILYKQFKDNNFDYKYHPCNFHSSITFSTVFCKIAQKDIIDEFKNIVDDNIKEKEPTLHALNKNFEIKDLFLNKLDKILENKDDDKKIKALNIFFEKLNYKEYYIDDRLHCLICNLITLYERSSEKSMLYIKEIACKLDFIHKVCPEWLLDQDIDLINNCLTIKQKEEVMASFKNRTEVIKNSYTRRVADKSDEYKIGLNMFIELVDNADQKSTSRYFSELIVNTKENGVYYEL